jgi:hypothetical protein
MGRTRWVYDERRAVEGLESIFDGRKPKREGAEMYESIRSKLRE